MPPTATSETKKEAKIETLEQREWSVVNGKQLIPNKYIMKWNEGMLKQCYYVGQHYHEWIDHPKLRRVRMFDSDFIEASSFTPWWVVPAIYIPWGILEARLSYQDFNNYNNDTPQSIITLFVQNILLQYIPSIYIINALLVMFLFGIGVLIWTLFEYFVHMHAFHWLPPSPSWNLAHFMGHGMHHLTPADKFRLVFPPAISTPLALLFRCIFYYLLFPFGVRSAVYGGFVVGYAGYESIHFLAHHNPFNSYLKERFRLHSAHHFNPHKQDKLYGVSTNIWDVVFGTFE